MDDVSISDTIAYRIVDSIISHIYSDEQMSDSEFLMIYRGFVNYGGSWQGIINGDPEEFRNLKKIIKAFVRIRKKPKKYGLK